MKEKTNEPGGGRTIILPVKRRNAITLEAAIQTWVDPLTTIVTDSWRGYNNLGNLGYTHHQINHKRYFVHPTSGEHTNNIEATWRALRLVSQTHYRNFLSTLINLIFLQSLCSRILARLA